MAVNAVGSGEARWQALPVALDAFDAIREAVTAAAEDTPRVRQALLACDEWVANVVSYSGANSFEFCFAAEGGELVVGFADDGEPFDPTQDRGEMADFDDLDLGGMGLILIRETAAEMAYERRDGRNVLSLRFDLGGDGPNQNI